MSKPLPSQTTFAGLPPPWQLTQLDGNFTNVWNSVDDWITYSVYVVDTGTPGALAVTLPAGLTASYSAGLTFDVLCANNALTTTPTFNVNSLGAKTIVDFAGNTLSNGAFIAGQIYRLIFDGTNFRVLNPSVYPTFSVGSPTAGAQFVIAAPAGQAATLFVEGNGNSGSNGLLVQQSGSGACRVKSGAVGSTLILGASGVDQMLLNGSAVTALGPFAATQVDMTPDRSAWTTTLSGPSWSAGTPTGSLKWSRVGPIVCIWAESPITGTTTTSATITASGLPAVITPSVSRNIISYGAGQRGIGADLMTVVVSSGGTLGLSPGFTANAANPTAINVTTSNPFDSGSVAGFPAGWSITYSV